MKCVYINLDQATRRRGALEASFSRHATPGFQLIRFAAVPAEDVEARKVDGKIRASERACFLSHRQVILDHPADGKPLMVVEDDVEFGPTFFRKISGLTQHGGTTPDVLFTDICVPGAGLMSEFARERLPLARTGAIALIDLRKAQFAAAAAYIILPHALPKVQAALSAVSRIDLPYDMYLRALIHRGYLRASVTFPFLTTLSDLSEDSEIQPEDSIVTDMIWNTFRKLMWADRDLPRCAPLLERIRHTCCDDESLMLAPILCAQASAKYRRK